MSILMPKKVKHRKWHKGRGRNRGAVETRATEINFGSFALKAVDEKWLTARQLESARRCIIRYLKKGGKLWVRVFPDKPVTFKGAEAALGGGKGAVDHYVFSVKPGRILFELDGIKEDVAREAFKGAGNKLPIRTKFIKKENI